MCEPVSEDNERAVCQSIAEVGPACGKSCNQCSCATMRLLFAHVGFLMHTA